MVPRASRRSVADAIAALAAAQRAQAEALTRLAIALDEDGTDELVPHDQWGFASRRRCAELAAAGEIPGAHKTGKTWVARRSALDTYVATRPVATPKKFEAPANDMDAEMTAAIARRAGGRR